MILDPRNGCPFGRHSLDCAQFGKLNVLFLMFNKCVKFRLARSNMHVNVHLGIGLHQATEAELDLLNVLTVR